MHSETVGLWLYSWSCQYVLHSGETDTEKESFWNDKFQIVGCIPQEENVHEGNTRDSDMNTFENPSQIFWTAMKMAKERQAITCSNSLKDTPSRMVVDENVIENTWKNHTENLMKEENKWIMKFAVVQNRDMQKVLAAVRYLGFLNVRILNGR